MDLSARYKQEEAPEHSASFSLSHRCLLKAPERSTLASCFQASHNAAGATTFKLTHHQCRKVLPVHRCIQAQFFKLSIYLSFDAPEISISLLCDEFRINFAGSGNLDVNFQNHLQIPYAGCTANVNLRVLCDDNLI